MNSTLAHSVSGSPSLVGGRVCLDFVNTVDPREGPVRRDAVADFEGFVRWSERAGVVSSRTAERLIAEARRRPKAARRAHGRAILLREALYRSLSAVARGAAPRDADLEVIMERFAAGVRRGGLVRENRVARSASWGWGWGWDVGITALGLPSWVLARDAVELMTGADVSRVKRCPGQDDCGWLFLDSSKNSSRRWCSMETCGTVAKVAERRRRATVRERR